MTIKGHDVGFVQILIGLLSGTTLIIVSFVAYFMKDTNERVRTVEKSTAVIGATQDAQGKENDRIRAELEDVRTVLYSHITRERN